MLIKSARASEASGYAKGAREGHILSLSAASSVRSPRAAKREAQGETMKLLDLGLPRTGTQCTQHLLALRPDHC